MSLFARRVAPDPHTLSQELSSIEPAAASLAPTLIRVDAPLDALPQLAAYAEETGCSVLVGEGRALVLGAEGSVVRLAYTLEEAAPSLASALLRALRPGVPSRLAARGRSLPLGRRTLIMGVLNVSPDSFSGDGVAGLDPAVQRAQEQLLAGADILDVGAMSTRPGSKPIPEDEEAERLFAVISAVRQTTDAMISADTYRLGPARAALEAGADIVNDITGARDPQLARAAAAAGAGLVVMHMLGMPSMMQLNPAYDDLVTDIYRSLHGGVSAALDAGLAREGILVDPGIGFGKTLEHNLELLRRLSEFRGLGCGVLVGTSRKGFIGRLTGRDASERAYGTAGSVAVAVANGADVVRVHDVAAMLDVLRVADAAVRGDAAAAGVEESRR